MRSNNLRHRVTFQVRGPEKDGLGQPKVLGWIDLATVWADIQPLNGRELMLAKANRSETTHAVAIRYQALFADPKAVAAMRIVYGSRILNIHASIDPEERRRDLNLSCSEGLNDG
ncbi:SPP1 family predicted phage head-tail adaptor [Oxalobacteraceae bacterium GrIS 1.11]